MIEPAWLPVEVIIQINRDIVADTGENHLVRDLNLLESASMRPQQWFSYENEHDIVVLATRLLFGIARNHPFEQGNKRTAFLAAYMFLELNGYIITCANNETIGKMITFTIEGKFTEAEFLEMFKPYVTPYEFKQEFANDESKASSEC